MVLVTPQMVYMPPPPPAHLKELTGTLPIMQFDTTLTPSLAQPQNGSQTSTTVNSHLANTPP